MSEHVQRAERSGISYYILSVGLLLVLIMALFDAYKKPRIAYVETTPNNARIYIEDRLVCESSPCKVNLQFWPKSIYVRAENYHSQKVPILTFKHFISDEQTYKISLKSFPKPLPQEIVIPNEDITEEKPILKPLENTVTEEDYSRPKKTPKQAAPELPLECQESDTERRLIQNREPVLCYYEEDKGVSSEMSGECYATYWVSRTGHVQNVHSYGCMESGLIEAAKHAFANRIYLPALRNGIAVNKVAEGEIKYGPSVAYYSISSLGESFDYALQDEPRQKSTLNGDARIITCPSAQPSAKMKRSGHCIFEFDLSSSGHVSEIRQIKCTHADIKTVTLSVLEQCQFKPARTDGVSVPRPYMTHQIDVNVYDSRRRRIPIHASFGEKVVNKPYIIYE